MTCPLSVFCRKRLRSRPPRALAWPCPCRAPRLACTPSLASAAPHTEAPIFARFG